MDALCIALGALALVFLALALIAWVRGSHARGEAVRLTKAAEETRRERDEARSASQRVQDRLGEAEAGRASAMASVEHLRPLGAKLEAAEDEVRRLKVELAGQTSRAEAERKASAERIADLTRLRGEMERDFKELANTALGANRQSFLSLADEVFKKHRAEATADVEARKKQVEALVEPISRQLTETTQWLEGFGRNQHRSQGEIATLMKSVGEEASRLTGALRSSPTARGRWGEESLRNALELAGLSPHCDFDTQRTFTAEDKRLRPDCVIRLPGGRRIVVDSKVSLEAYVDGCDAEDESARAVSMKRHADDMRRHMIALSRKDYWDAVTKDLSTRPDFVAMYVPGENFFSAAVAHNADLINEAIAKGVFIVTPTTLIALAKAIALGWQQEAIAENAKHIAELGRELYKRLAVMGGHIAKTGSSLEAAVKAHNAFVGSIEGSVLPQARRFRELQVADAGKEIAAVEPIQVEIRDPARGRDLRFGSEADLLRLTAEAD